MSQGSGIYKYFSFAVEAGFYSDVVECLPLNLGVEGLIPG